MIIRHFTDIKPENPVKGVKKRVVIGDKEGATNFIMRVFDVSPETITSYHDHFWEHEIFVVSGEAYIRNDHAEDTLLKPGDTVFVPPYEKHCMVNKGEEVFRFVCIIPSGVEN